MFDLPEYNPVTYQEAERKAYFAGDAEKASLYARIMELEEQLEEQNQQIIELENQIEKQEEQIKELEESIADFDDKIAQIKDIL